MTLLDYVTDTLKDGPELFVDEKLVTASNGVKLTRDCTRLRAISLGVISSNTPSEWYRICRLSCPVGIVIEDYDEAKWKPLYEDTLALVRNELTRALLRERNAKSAKVLLDIMSKRDSEHWDNSKESSVELKHGEQTITFKFASLKEN